MVTILFYYIPGIPGHFYKVQEDGYILRYNIDTCSLENISDEIGSIQPFWVMIDIYEFYEKILDFHEESFVKSEKEYMSTPEGQAYFKDIVLGETFEYYTDGKILACRDENFNEYYFKNNTMNIIKNTIIEPDWVKMDRVDVIPFILNELQFPSALKSMDLYLDSHGDIIGIDEDFRYFRISRRTGDMKEISNEDGMGDDWKHIDINYFDENFISHEPSILGSTLKGRREMEVYLQKCKERLLEDYNMVLDKDLCYYDNSFGCVYALDSNNHQYKVTPEGFIPLKKDCIDTENWRRVYHVNVLPISKIYEKRKINRSSVNPIYTVYDLDLYISNDNLVFGYAENGEIYILYKDGIFYNINNFNNPESLELTKNPISKVDVLIRQKMSMFDDIINEYLCYWAVNSKNRLEIAIDENASYYITKDTGDLYIVDGNRSEFACLVNRLIPLKIGSVRGQNFEEIDSECFFSILLTKDSEAVLEK